MRLHINDGLRVRDLQERFQKCFPLLKICFYTKPHKQFQALGEAYLVTEEKCIGEIRLKGESGFFEIKSWYTTAKVETELEQRFGLHAQIFRSRPDGSWIQTSLSDDLTLYEQSELNNFLLRQSKNTKR